MPTTDEPRPDTRPPAYGCGPSFGMLGPSRVFVLPAYVPEGFEDSSGGFALPFLTEGTGSPPWFAQWKGVFDDCEVSLFLSCLNLRDGLWRMNVDLNATPPTASGGATREFTNFQWQFPVVILSDDITENWGNFAVYRIGEWQTVTARFPNARIAEEV